jgi:hypothetical protein
VASEGGEHDELMIMAYKKIERAKGYWIYHGETERDYLTSTDQDTIVGDDR